MLKRLIVYENPVGGDNLRPKLDVDNASDIDFCNDILSFLAYGPDPKNPNHRIKQGYIYSMRALVPSGRWILKIVNKEDI